MVPCALACVLCGDEILPLALAHWCAWIWLVLCMRGRVRMRVRVHEMLSTKCLFGNSTNCRFICDHFAIRISCSYLFFSRQNQLTNESVNLWRILSSFYGSNLILKHWSIKPLKHWNSRSHILYFIPATDGTRAQFTFIFFAPITVEITRCLLFLFLLLIRLISFYFSFCSIRSDLIRLDCA